MTEDQDKLLCLVMALIYLAPFVLGLWLLRRMDKEAHPADKPKRSNEQDWERRHARFIEKDEHGNWRIK